MLTLPADHSIVDLLNRVASGDATARGDLYARLYPDIKRIARARLSSSGGIADLDTTALVHEGFLRVSDLRALDGRSRGEFLAYVGRVLRSVVIDHLRAARADKRDSGGLLLTLGAAAAEPALLSDAVDLIALDRALAEMERLDPALDELLEMVLFSGATVAEVAECRGVSRRTVERDLLKGRALLRELLDRPVGR